MTYDFHGQWERTVGHNSPLFPLESATSYQKKLTVDFSAREWVKQGAPKEKLLIGMPTYGRSFELVNDTQFDIGSPASGGGKPGKFTNEAGFLSYYEICAFLAGKNTTLVWDSEQQVPFAYRNNQWVGFDDERSLKTKVSVKFTGHWKAIVTAIRGLIISSRPFFPDLRQRSSIAAFSFCLDGGSELVPFNDAEFLF